MKAIMLLCIVWMVVLLVGGEGLEEGSAICSSVDVRNTVEELRQLSGCRVVEGFVRVVLIDKANSSEYAEFSFPLLQEITDYLLFYRAAGLLSLGSLFPNLTVIRGNSLFVDYALVVYDMMHITELGLGSLTTILRGSVRIEQNHRLCFLHTVNWKSIIANGDLYAVNNNPEQVLCPSCATTCDSQHCWGRDVCQKMDGKGKGCHAQCLGGCTGPGPHQCSACTRVMDDAGVCIQNCPPHRYEFMGRRCVTDEQCRSLEVPSVHLQRSLLPGLPSQAWIPFNGSCCLMCPLGYQPTLNKFGKHTCERCIGYCRKVCGSGDVIPIESIFHIQQLNGCTYINGSLVIRLLMGKQIVEELEDNFDGIEEISGFLKIHFSYPLTSLNFLKKLRVIHGMELENGQFALTIVRNDNLQVLWNWDSRPKNFTIKNGTLSIHSNPKLCMSEIDQFRDIAGFYNDSAVEISLESNGNNIACRPIKMAAYSTVINSTAVRIEWGYFHTSIDPKTLLGYIVHYKETRDENVTLHKDHDECADDKWRVAYVILNSQTCLLSHVITRLKPFTLYAYYVETYSTALATVGGRSSVQFFRTFPDRPSIPRYLRAYSNSSSQIVLHWQPPLFPNGEISHYIIVGWRHYDDGPQRDYCQFPLEPLKEESEDQLLLHQPDANDCYSHQAAPETCISNDDSRFNFIYTEEAVNEEQDSCDQQTSIYSVLYSHRLYGNGGGIYDAIDLAHGHFKQRTEGNTTTAVLTDLYHFAQYTIEVVACRKSRLGTIDHNWNDSHCSPASLITTRTRKLDGADDINSTLVKVTVDSGTVRVFWLEPLQPNGIIVLYHVEYRRTDIINFKPVLQCLTTSQFERAKNVHVLNNMPPGKYSFRIKATSLAGQSSFTDYVDFVVKQEVVAQNYQSEIIILSTVVVTLLTVLSGLMFCFWRRMKKQSEAATTIVTSMNPEYISMAVYEPDEWEIVRDKVEIVRELSRGTFGIVYEGILYPANISCAVKTVDEKASVRERIEFLNEASVMKSFAGGHHVVKLIGVVSRGQPPLVVMELMALGDLKSFLREARNTSLCPMLLSEVLRMAAQIADGMAYLEASKFVHRDLAARNCMISETAVVKIGDFGMTRDIYQRDYYRKANRGLLPVRWMAPESLGDGVFTNQSDVWSYGVVLWEMATFAEQPYQGLSNEQVLQFVLRGNLLEKPMGCPEIVHRLMLACWQHRPSDRPTFLNLVSILDAVTDVGDEFRQTSFFHSQTGVELMAAFKQSPPSLSNLNTVSKAEYLDMGGTKEANDYVLSDIGS